MPRPPHVSVAVRLPHLATAVLATLGLAARGWSATPIAFHEANVLGTSLDLTVNTPNPADADAVRAVVLAEIGRLEKVLSAYDTTSDLARVNATRDAVRVGPELLDVLSAYDDWSTRTSGAYSAQVGDLKALWAEAIKGGKVPDEASVRAAVEAIREPLWRIDRAAGTVQRLADRRINVDSLGKGYVVTAAMNAAKARGPAVEGVLLNLGGDLAASGFGTPGRKIKWTLRVADPANPADNARPICELRLSDLTVATSGGYARNATLDGATYSHLIDPRTGRPVGVTADGRPDRAAVASATVIAPDNATANALATSICVLGAEEGMKLVRATPDAECLIVLNGGGRVRSDGFKRFEIPRGDEKGQSPIAGEPGDRWPARQVVEVDVPVKPNPDRADERPYVAIWIEDDQQQHVKTLAVWGNEDRWLKQMDFWSKVHKAQPTLMNSVTRATRPAGHYTFAWDGTDQLGRPVPQGTYQVWVEVSYEHGARVGKSVAVACGPTPTAVTLDATEGFDPAPIAYKQPD